MRIRLATCLVVLLFAFSALPVNAAMQSDSRNPGEDKIVTSDWSTAAPLTNTTNTLLQGERVENEVCKFTVTLKVSPSDSIRVKTARPLWTNLTKCQQMLEIGTPSDVGAEPVAAQAPAGEIQPMGFTTKTAYFKTTWRDPVNLMVNYVQDQITWTFNMSSVSSYSPSHFDWWEQNTGWYRVSSSNYDGWGDTSHIKAQAWSYSQYKNQDFALCPANRDNPTTTTYWPNWLNVWADGTADGTVTTYVGGGCSSLLHYETQLSNP